jgi:tetraacyldisaccharide 4'-kinase
MSYLRLLLLPFSLLYLIILGIRNLLFNIGIFKSQRFNIPVISVGNITTGGTGKTPMVIYLTYYLISKGKSVGVISRGYKSNSKELVIAYDGHSVISDINSTGDELAMIVNRFRGNSKFYAIAYHNRVKAIDLMITKFSPDVIILDDAFQNKWIKKELDIIMIDKEDKSILRFIVLPAGNLRETKISLRRADIIFNNFKFNKPGSLNIKGTNNIEYSYSGFFDFKGDKAIFANNKKAILISGIASNNSFSNAVSMHDIYIYKTYNLSDHYNYSSADIEKYKKEYSDDIIFLTTEKDFIKIREFEDFIFNYPVYFLRIDVILDNIYLDNILIEKGII